MARGLMGAVFQVIHPCVIIEHGIHGDGFGFSGVLCIHGAGGVNG